MRIRLANKTIEVENLYPYVEEYCKDYVTSREVETDFLFRVIQKDIEFERDRSEQEDIAERREIRHFSDEYLETLAVYRKIAEQMPFYDTVLFHGSVVAVNGEGYLFTAKSGTGKSTHTRLWRTMLGRRAVMVNDDKPLIRIAKDNSATVYGTPWDGKHRLSSNTSAPLKGICILRRAEENHIREITKSEAYPMLLQQVYRPADPEAMKATLLLLDRLKVKLFCLHCNMDIHAAEVAYRAMAGTDTEEGKGKEIG